MWGMSGAFLPRKVFDVKFGGPGGRRTGVRSQLERDPYRFLGGRPGGCKGMQRNAGGERSGQSERHCGFRKIL